jgi:hypothetical protein
LTADRTNHVIVIDRWIDLLTQLITQINYEGLLAEFLEIGCGWVMSSGGKSQLQVLSSKSDMLFRDFRTLNHQK